MNFDTIDDKYFKEVHTFASILALGLQLEFEQNGMGGLAQPRAVDLFTVIALLSGLSCQADLSQLPERLAEFHERLAAFKRAKEATSLS